MPDNIDGKSFAKVLTGATDKHRDLIFTAHSGDGKMNVYPIRAVRDSRYKYIRNIHPEAWHTTHTDIQRRPDHGSFFTEWEVAAKSDAHAQAVISRFHRRPAVEFYDLTSDPEETNNLASNSEYSAVAEKMAKQLDDWMQENEDAVRMEHKPYLLSESYPGPKRLVVLRNSLI